MSDPWSENTTAWLSTTASQIFFMQLGFLCYEAGFVKPVWTQSIILKNIEDTFVAILVFMLFGYTLSESPNSFYGIISVPTNPFLIGVSEEHHDQILISAFFASTSATIISGAVLERMKNKAYVIWCLLIVLVNYSFVSHWVWHDDGWLSKLGFIDGAGAVVVHSTAGVASLVAVWRLGPRNGAIDKRGKLLPIEPATRPIINVTGAFFLWFGWFAFNVSSPIAFTRGIGDAIGTTALVTVISPVCASYGAFLWMYLGFVDLTYEELMSCLLAGLVGVTGPCHNCNVWSAAVIGFLCSIIYYCMAYIVRYKWSLDDPLQVIAIHGFCGLVSGIAEGIVANDVYGEVGLIYGGYKHFGVQVLGVVVIAVFNFVVCVFLYDVILRSCLFRGCNMRVSVLDVYLGTRLFAHDCGVALDEVLKCNSNVSRRMLWQFHEYILQRCASEQLDFLIAVNVLNNYVLNQNHDIMVTAKYIIQIMDTYIEEAGTKCINVSGTQRGILLKFKRQTLLLMEEENSNRNDDDDKKEEEEPEISIEIASRTHFKLEMLRENIFKYSYNEVWKTVIPHFSDFLGTEFKPKEKGKKKFDVQIPFKLTPCWELEWDDTITKETESIQLVDTVPQTVASDATLLRKPKANIGATVVDAAADVHEQQQRTQHIQLSDVQRAQYPVIFKDDQSIGDATIIIE